MEILKYSEALKSNDIIVLSPKLKFLLQKSVEEFAILFDSSNSQHLPIFRMSLTFDDEKMEIYPTLQDLEATIFEILTSMTNTLQVKFCTCSYLFIYNKHKNTGLKLSFENLCYLDKLISENTAGLTVAG